MRKQRREDTNMRKLEMTFHPKDRDCSGGGGGDGDGDGVSNMWSQGVIGERVRVDSPKEDTIGVESSFKDWRKKLEWKPWMKKRKNNDGRDEEVVII
ncbi:hypothetical protein Tco_0132320 [Tanacetum coccineum]